MVWTYAKTITMCFLWILMFKMESYNSTLPNTQTRQKLNFSVQSNNIYSHNFYFFNHKKHYQECNSSESQTASPRMIRFIGNKMTKTLHTLDSSLETWQQPFFPSQRLTTSSMIAQTKRQLTPTLQGCSVLFSLSVM